MKTAAPHSMSTRPDPVQGWRLAELLRAGYPPQDGLVLSARLDIDLHLAVALLRNGCPPATAMRILL